MAWRALERVAAVAGLIAIGAAAAVVRAASGNEGPAACAGAGASCAAAPGGGEDMTGLLQMDKFRRIHTDQLPARPKDWYEVQDPTFGGWPALDPKRGRNFTGYEEKLEVFAEISNTMYHFWFSQPTNSTLGRDLPQEDWPNINETAIGEAHYKIERCWEEGNDNTSFTYVPTFCVFKNCKKKNVIIGIKGSTRFMDLVADMDYFWLRNFPGDAVYTELFWTFFGSVLDEYKVMVTGHSLGGYIAEVLSGMFGLPGFAFNSPGPDATNVEFHSGRRFGLQTPRSFHVVRAPWDVIVNNPNVFHSVPPIWLKGASSHLMPATLAYLRRVPGFKEMTNQNILDYVSLGQRRRRGGYWMSKTGWCDGQRCPRPQPICRDSNTCLRKQLGLLGTFKAGRTCAAAAKYCGSARWGPDMLQCCPVTCFNRRVDMSEAECKLEGEGWNGQCFNSDACLQATWRDIAATCDSSAQECDSDGQKLIDMLNCCPLTCQERAGNETRELMEDAPCNRGTPQNDDNCYRYYVKQAIGDAETYNNVSWRDLRCEMNTTWFADRCNRGRAEHLAEVSNEVRCCRSACKRIVKRLGLEEPRRPEALDVLTTRDAQSNEADVYCAGTLNVAGFGANGTIQLVQTYAGHVRTEDGRRIIPPVEIVDGGTTVRLGHLARVYFSYGCQEAGMTNTDYVAQGLLGKKLSYTVKLGPNVGCGCAATMYFTTMAHNENKGLCGDHYCDPSDQCGVRCAAVVIQETSTFGWRTMLQTKDDPDGNVHGYGGGTSESNGGRDWKREQWNPNSSTCIDTSKEMNVSALFPKDPNGRLPWIQVKITQGNCTVSTKRIAEYGIVRVTGSVIDGMKEMSAALRAGMTPVLSYWSSSDMNKLDGPGKDRKGGGCVYGGEVTHPTCAPYVEYSNFAVTDLSPWLPFRDPDPINDDCV